jgi:hypothetical protein
LNNSIEALWKAGSPKRELILDAAIPVFGRFGFKKTSIDDLAEAACRGNRSWMNARMFIFTDPGNFLEPIR